tara:strand:+ start:223 stop:669 length:447 start_codon:yes stop_codon:yes gene_type:complete
MALSALAIGLLAVSAGMTVLSTLAANAAAAAERRRKENLAKLEGSIKKTSLTQREILFEKRLALMTAAQGVQHAGTPLLIGEEAEKEYNKNVDAINRATLYGVWGAKEDYKNKRMANLVNMGSNLAQISLTGYQMGQEAKWAELGLLK